MSHPEPEKTPAAVAPSAAPSEAPRAAAPSRRKITRNPLGVIRSSNFYLQRKTKEQDEKTLKHFRRIEEQVALCDTIVADLLEYTRSRRANMVRQALESWLPQVVEQMQESEGLEIGLRISADNVLQLPNHFLWFSSLAQFKRVLILFFSCFLSYTSDWRTYKLAF